jgi:pimeloyl-ACP methyl ester carboxylesterase
MTKLKGLARIMSLALAAISGTGAAMDKSMFLTLGTVFAYDEPSTTTVRLFDGSSFTFACERYVSERGIIADRGRPALVVRTRCESADRPQAGTAIYLHGGPFTKFDGKLRAEQAALLDLGYEVVTPLYVSSGDRELSVKVDDKRPLIGGRVVPDMNDAIAELAAVVRAAQRAEGRVILYGESYGGFLAAALADRLRPSDKLVLHGPMLNSFGELMRMTGGPIRLNDFMPQHLSLDQQDELSRKIFTRFYGAWADRDVVSLLASRPPHNMLVVYGENDEKMGIEHLPALLALGARPLPLRGAGHEGFRSRSDLDRLIAELKQ